ncbi:MAG: zf-HC2 domain-containing protein [Acidobacteriales bacterium]|nr:zf-HC2 domain-containing protein [Terriglobales bacterium]
MKCTSFDLNAYYFGELPADERRGVEEHVAACAACRAELERLRVTQTALASIPDEEIPQRVAFVSDKIFEPTWWQRLWRPGPQWALVSAGLVAAAILLHGYMYRPAAAPALEAQVIETRVEAELARRLPVALDEAVARLEARHQVQVREAVAAVEKRAEIERKAQMVAFEENLDVLRKRFNVMYLASANMGGR